MRSVGMIVLVVDTFSLKNRFVLTDGVKEEYFDDGSPPNVTHVNGLPIESELNYRVATKISDLTNGQCPAWTECK